LLHPELIRRGIRFADPQTAAQFAVEEPTEWGDDQSSCCGYHGQSKEPTAWLRAELPYWLARQRFTRAGGKIRVIVNGYRAADQTRRNELSLCQSKLYGNSLIDVVRILEHPDDRRATFGELAAAVQSNAGPDDICVILNADCHLDHSVIDLTRLTVDDFAAITRREREPGCYFRLWEEMGHCSQDAWAWRGPLRADLGDILPGTVGCDNKLAWIAHQAGYRVLNPSRDVAVYHHHSQPDRSALPRLPGPYLEAWPGRFGEQPRTRLIAYVDLSLGAAFRLDGEERQTDAA
jgi:hypothetical protein